MKKHLFTVALLAAAGLLCAETVSFEKSPEKMLKISTHQKEMRSETLFDKQDLANFRFTAEFQTFNLNPTDQHTGFLFQGSRHNLHLLTRGGDFSFVPLKGGEQSVGAISPKLSNTLSDKWNTIELTCRNGFIELNCNGKFVGSFDFDLGKLVRAQAYGYRGDFAVRSASLEPLPEQAADFDPAAPPLLHATFDGNTDAGNVKAKSADSIRFVPGLKGQAVEITTPERGPSGIRYPVTLNPDAGAFSFWFRPDWEGELRDSMPWYYLLSGIGADGKNKMSVFWWHWLRADLPRRGDLDTMSLNRRARSINHPGDWMHMAIVYNNNGWSTIYINGLPYRIGSTWLEEKPVRVGNFDLGKVREILVGSNTETNGLLCAVDGAIDEFKVYGRPLTQAEVSADYREFYPFDLMLDKAAFTVDEPVKLELAVAPADYYSIPKPEGYEPGKPLVPRRVTLKLYDPREKKVLKQESFNPEATTAPRILTLDAGKLPQKLYHLQVEIENPQGVPARRSFPVTVYEPGYRAKEATGQELEVGRLLFSRDLTVPQKEGFLSDVPVRTVESAAGAYTEAGMRKGNRFSFEIPFKMAQRKGRPVLLEIEWPDDKPRSMGLYMYVRSEAAQHRDRLEGGIQAGEEYPNSGRMQKTRYLFYPGASRYLFEARTMVEAYPAAVARVNVYELKGELPRLAVHRPEGYTPRSFGHLDEDQTVDMTVDRDNEDRLKSCFRTGRVTDKLSEYMNYTGQNMLSYSLLRYDFPFYPLNSYNGNGLLPYAPGDVPLFINMFHANGIDFVSSVNIYNLPDFNLQPQNRAALREEGMLLHSYKDEAAESARPNFFHPEARRLILDHIRFIVGRYGRLPGFRGIDLWGGFTLGAEDGYDNQTAGLFAKQQKIDLPASQKERHALFNSARYRDQWLKFRADGLTAFLGDVASLVREINPALSIVLSVSGEPLRGSSTLESGDPVDTEKWYYENNGIDLEAINRIPGLKLGAMRYWTDYRWTKHWGKPESTIDEQLYDLKRMKLFAPTGIANCYAQYFETFNNSLNPKVFNAYFQNADVKPHGRFFLKELVFNVAATDAVRILVGAQPFGTWGRDAEAREFARAYTSLPAEKFTDAVGPSDPVTVRYFQGKQGTYLYAASLLWEEGAVTLELPAGTLLTDLSSGEKLTVPEDGRLTLPLESYQLRSFLTSDKVSPKVAGVQISERQKAAVARRIAELDKTIAFLREADVAVKPAVIARLEAVRKAVADNEYAEAHRLLFSKMLNGVIRQLPLAENGHLLKQQQMIAQNRFAVNCGSGEYDYYVAKDGTLFFPDHAWDGVYGSVSDGSQIGRPIQTIRGTENPELYATEAYNLDAYRFKLANGTYTVRIYLKIGYEPNAKPGAGVFSLTANGKPLLNNFDPFLETGGFDNAITREFKGVEVGNGILNLDFSVPDGVHPSVRFLNAIEVIPEK